MPQLTTEHWTRLRGARQDRIPQAERPHAPKRAPIYDPKADAKADIEAALKLAKRENKRVLIEFGGNWCGWCYRLYDVFKKDNEVSAIFNKRFILVLVDVDTNRKLLNAYVSEKERRGFPFLTVLDANGNVLRNQRTDELEDGSKHDVAKVKAFLSEWSSSNEK